MGSNGTNQLSPAAAALAASVAAWERRLAADRRARGRAQAAFAVLLGLSLGLFGLWAGLSSGLAWNAPQPGGGAQLPLALLGHCLALALLFGGAFWGETRLSGAGFAELLDRVEGREGEISTAYELCQSRPNQPFLPLLCRRLLEAPRSAAHWRAISPPAWVAALPLLLGATLALSALGNQGAPPAGLPELLEQSVRHLADAAARAPAAAPRRGADGQRPLAAAQELERQAWQRAQSALGDLAHRAAGERNLAQLEAPLEEVRRQLAALGAQQRSSAPAAAALAKANAALDAAQYLASRARVDRGASARPAPPEGRPARPGEREKREAPGAVPAVAPPDGQASDLPGDTPQAPSSRAQPEAPGAPATGSGSGPGASGAAPGPSISPQPDGAAAPVPQDPAAGVPAPLPPPAEPPRALLAGPGPSLSPAEERVVSAWLKAQRRPTQASGGF